MIKIVKNTWLLPLVNEFHNIIDSLDKDSSVVQNIFEGRNLPLWPCFTPYNHTIIVLQILLISNNYYVSKKCIQTVRAQTVTDKMIVIKSLCIIYYVYTLTIIFYYTYNWYT